VCKADNLPPSCAVVTKSGNLNFLEPFGSVQGCNGTALPLPIISAAERSHCVVASLSFRHCTAGVIRLVTACFSIVGPFTYQ